jgi:hypothetical protein
MPTAKPGPIPAFPAKTRLPTFKTSSKQSGTISVPTSTTFYYAGIQAIWLWWLVDLKLLQSYVDPYEITAYDFGGGNGAVNVNFFNAVAMYGTGTPGNQGVGGFNETELNVVGFATKVAVNVPMGIALHDFLATGEPTKRVGNMRLWVACDDAVAVAAGRQVYFENKFLTPYSYTVPGLNSPAPPALYKWTCHDPNNQKISIYGATVDLSGLSPTPGNMSEWIDLSFDAKSRRPVGSRRNYFGMYNTYLLSSGNKAVRLQIGSSKHPMRTDMQKLIGSRSPAAIQTFSSPTCIAEAAGYYADL